MKLNANKNQTLIIFIIAIAMYHYYIHNGIEKIFFQTYFQYNDVKRPLTKCININNISNLACIGMPSGHAETASIFFFLLYLNKILPLWITLILIFIFCLQRIIVNKHTISQVIVGSIFGLLYAVIYKQFSLGFFIVFSIGFILVLLSMYKIDQEVYRPIPNWVDNSMYESIKKKQMSPLYIKIGSIYTNSVIQDRTFISWNELETYLDEMVDRIKRTGITFDAVVGIKTGGAIISDYISVKLGILNYKIKLSREEYNCNKKSIHILDDIIKKNFYGKKCKFTICEGIDDNLEGKNIILVDELVSTGITMIESYNYMKQQKNANLIYPTCIVLNNKKYRESLPISNVFYGTVLIWPWGYEN